MNYLNIFGAIEYGILQFAGSLGIYPSVPLVHPQGNNNEVVSGLSNQSASIISDVKKEIL